jgi:thrombospondin type 3 repeat protein
MRKRVILFLAALIAGAHGALADPAGLHVDLAQIGGSTSFGDGARVEGRAVRDALYLGMRLGVQLHPLWSLEAAGGDTPTTEKGAPDRDADLFHLSGNLMFTPWARLRGGPYAFVGGGLSRLKSPVGGGASRGGLETGGGARLWLTDRVGARLEVRQAFYSAEDGRPNPLTIGGGLLYAFGARPRDRDRDGVADRLDGDPSTPLGAKVDDRGVPHDTDGDGVPDGIDTCINTPFGAAVDERGCPHDTDGDGVADGIDTCNDTPLGAAVDAQGCTHDADGDGVPDGLDTCASTPPGAKVDGRGCPIDTDGDGVPDGLDACPNTLLGLRVDKGGCPVDVIEKEAELRDTGAIRLEGAEIDSAGVLLPAAVRPALDVIGVVLEEWPDLRVEIGVHTDGRAPEGQEAPRSEAWAAAVKGYLVGRFPEIHAERLQSRGYGATRLLVPVESGQSSARNRRVEFVVLNPEVLRRASGERGSRARAAAEGRVGARPQ